MWSGNVTGCGVGVYLGVVPSGAGGGGLLQLLYLELELDQLLQLLE